MNQVKPQGDVLKKWRLQLALLVFVPAFITSLFFRLGGGWWLLFTALWLLVFLFFYLFFLPMRYSNLSFVVSGDQIVHSSGVFYRRVRTMPLPSIQFTGKVTTLFDKPWGLASLVVNAPGGRIRIPGLKEADAELLAQMLTEPSGKREAN